jgi:transcriptional regulator of acetoin/glycerol metabolism
MIDEKPQVSNFFVLLTKKEGWILELKNTYLNESEVPVIRMWRGLCTSNEYLCQFQNDLDSNME